MGEFEPGLEQRALPRAVIRELDRRAIEEWGIPSFALMESAGRACAEHARRLLLAIPHRSGRRGLVHVLVGPGNNGGDGFVIARTLLQDFEGSVRVSYLGADPATLPLSADFQLNWKLWTGLGQPITQVRFTSPVPGTWLSTLGDDALIVDALFGNGLSRPLGEPWKSAIERVNASGLPVLAVDVPSGLDADTGAVLGAAIRATATVTFIAPKLGFFRGAGPDHVGRVHVAEIGVPQAWIEAELARASR